jgi:hypothetical protein
VPHGRKTALLIVKKGSCQQSSHQQKEVAHLPKPNNTIKVIDTTRVTSEQNEVV